MKPKTKNAAGLAVIGVGSWYAWKAWKASKVEPVVEDPADAYVNEDPAEGESSFYYDAYLTELGY